jgi:nicotinate-nucleotide adenylyltransferase
VKKHIDILIFGGSFDPIHNGHLSMLKAAIEYCEPQHTLVIPNTLSPLKATTLFSNKERYKMVERAIETHLNDASIEVSDIEIRRGEKSYTVETLRELSDTYKGLKLGFLCGADTVLSLHDWVEPNEILSMVTLVVIPRDNASKSDVETYLNTHFPSADVMILEAHRHPASSTQIRAGITGEKDVLNHIPKGIESLIKEFYDGSRNNR